MVVYRQGNNFLFFDEEPENEPNNGWQKSSKEEYDEYVASQMPIQEDSEDEGNVQPIASE